MTPKIPPSYDGSGRVSWFAYEEHVRDWEDICQLEEAQRGLGLRQRQAVGRDDQTRGLPQKNFVRNRNKLH